MGETFRDPQQLKIVLRGLRLKVEAGPFAEIGRVAAEIDSNVPDMPGEDADKFALGLAELVMQTPEHAFDGKGLVVLNELFRETGGRKG